LLEASPAWCANLMIFNTFMLGNRIFQRVYFVTRLNGLLHGLLSIPRLVVNNFINFFAVCRAWRLFIASAVTGEPIGWDKTKHSYPSREDLQLVHRGLGELLLSWHAISREQLDEALAIQHIQTGRRLGELLVDSAGLDIETLADAVAWQAGLPRVELGCRDWRSFATRLPAYVEVRHAAIPFGIGEAAALNVAVAAPLSATALAQLRAAAGAEIQCFIASEADIATALQELKSATRTPSGSSKVEQ
jgi:adsorption protein B